MPALPLLLLLNLFGLPTQAPRADWMLSNQKNQAAADGVEYRKYYLKTERGGVNLHAVWIDKDAGFGLMPVIANSKLNTVSDVDRLAAKVSAVAAINGGFFDTGKTRLPVGLVKIKRRIIFEQFLNRAVLGIDEQGKLHFDTFRLKSSFDVPGVKESVPVHGYNRKRKAGELIVYTPEFGETTKTNEWGVEIVLHRISPDRIDKEFILLEPDRYIITAVNHHSSTIPSDGIVLSVHKSALANMGWLRDVYLGMELQLKSNVPQGWESFPYLLGGGPMLLKQGRVVLDAKSESFGPYFKGANARTAVGRTADGHSVIIVVDKGGAGGCSWEELAVISRDLLKLSDLMGFDGGGSSTMFVKDKVVNAPTGGGQRRVANILAVVPFEKFI
jgi:hypothetical protein